MNRLSVLAATLVVMLGAGCAVQTPTIAHTHIGHAITGFDGTPGDKGLFAVAEERALAAKLIAENLDPGGDINTVKREVGRIVDETASDAYGLKRAIAEAISHVNWAMKSIDASDNLRQAPATLAEGVDAVVSRCDLIVLTANDVVTSTSPDEIEVLAGQIRELAIANLVGSADREGRIGSAPSEQGVEQLRQQLDALVAREDPRYEPVARWYLFHLVRLPDCDNCWSWRKWAKTSNRGY